MIICTYDDFAAEWTSRWTQHEMIVMLNKNVKYYLVKYCILKAKNITQRICCSSTWPLYICSCKNANSKLRANTWWYTSKQHYSSIHKVQYKLMVFSQLTDYGTFASSINKVMHCCARKSYTENGEMLPWLLLCSLPICSQYLLLDML